MPESKKQLREEMLASFAQLSEEEHSKISNQLQQRLFQSGLWENAKTIAVYLSVRNEWDTRKNCRTGLGRWEKSGHSKNHSRYERNVFL